MKALVLFCTLVSVAQAQEQRIRLETYVNDIVSITNGDKFDKSFIDYWTAQLTKDLNDQGKAIEWTQRTNKGSVQLTIKVSTRDRIDVPRVRIVARTDSLLPVIQEGDIVDQVFINTWMSYISRVANNRAYVIIWQQWFYVDRYVLNLVVTPLPI